MLCGSVFYRCAQLYRAVQPTAAVAVLFGRRASLHKVASAEALEQTLKHTTLEPATNLGAFTLSYTVLRWRLIPPIVMLRPLGAGIIEAVEWALADFEKSQRQQDAVHVDVAVRSVESQEKQTASSDLRRQLVATKRAKAGRLPNKEEPSADAKRAALENKRVVLLRKAARESEHKNPRGEHFYTFVLMSDGKVR